MPLPIMALLRLNEDIPKEVLPLCCWVQEQKMAIHLHFTEHDWLIILIAGVPYTAPLMPRGGAFSRFPSPEALVTKRSLSQRQLCW